DATQVTEHDFVSAGHRAKQASPRKVNVDLIGHALQLAGKLLDCGLHEQHVRAAPSCGLAMDLLRDLRQRSRRSIDPDIELIGIQASGLVDKETVARPDVDDHPPAAGRGQEALAGHLTLVSRTPYLG